jgi:hypothetical protein
LGLYERRVISYVYILPLLEISLTTLNSFNIQEYMEVLNHVLRFLSRIVITWLNAWRLDAWTHGSCMPDIEKMFLICVFCVMWHMVQSNSQNRRRALEQKSIIPRKKRLSHETNFYSLVAQCGINYMGNSCLHAAC